MLDLLQTQAALLGKFDAVIIEGHFQGPANARNRGLDRVDTPYVVFWDSDDQPNISAVVDSLSNTSLSTREVIIGAFSITRPGVDGVKFQTSNFSQLARNPGLWRCAFPADLIGNTRFPNILLGEDQVFLARIINSASRIKFVDEVFYDYKFGTTSQLTSTKNYRSLLAAEKLIFEIDKKNPHSENADFLLTLRIRQLATILLRGKMNLRLIAFLKLIAMILSVPTKTMSTLKSLLNMPDSEKFHA